MKNKRGRKRKAVDAFPHYLDDPAALLHELPDIVYKIDPKGYFTFVNKSVSILGYKPDELIGRHFSKIIHPDDVRAFGRRYVLPRYKGKATGDEGAPKLFDERRTGTRKTKDLEIQLMPKKQTGGKMRIGTVIAFGDVSSVGSYDVDSTQRKKKFLGTLGIIRDLTERKLTELALKKYRLITENTSDLIALATFDRNVTYTYISPSHKKILGYEPDELVGKSGLDFIHPEDRLKLLPKLWKYVSAKVKKSLKMQDQDLFEELEFRVRNKFGKPHCLQATVNIVGDELLFVSKDITERKQIEEKLHYQADMLQHVSDAIVSTDLDFKIRTWNRAAEAMYGWQMREAVGRPLMKFVMSKLHFSWRKKLLEQLHKNGVWQGELRQERKDGAFMDVLSIVTFMKDSSGKPIGFIAVNRDITARKKMENDLREALNELNKKQNDLRELTKKIIRAQEEERRRLALVIHDEFLQGVVSILYFLQTIDVSFNRDSQKTKEGLIEIVKASIDKGRALLSQIEPVREPHTGLIAAVKRTIGMLFTDPSIKVRFIHPRGMPTLKREVETNIYRIIQEALFNVCKHAKATSIFVKIMVDKDNLDLEIRDNGVGFIPALVVKKKTGHYGLLSMQERTHLLGGSMTINSSPGRGTMKKFSFPFS